MPKKRFENHIPITADTREEMMELMKGIYAEHGKEVPTPKFTHHLELFMDDDDSPLATSVAWSHDRDGELADGAESDMLMAMILAMQQMLCQMGLNISANAVARLYTIIDEESNARTALESHHHGPHGGCPHMN